MARASRAAAFGCKNVLVERVDLGLERVAPRARSAEKEGRRERKGREEEGQEPAGRRADPGGLGPDLPVRAQRGPAERRDGFLELDGGALAAGRRQQKNDRHIEKEVRRDDRRDPAPEPGRGGDRARNHSRGPEEVEHPEDNDEAGQEEGDEEEGT